jgi:hypothetical protein
MIFAWYDADEAWKQAVGLTRDISIGGAFVFAVSPPPLETNVEFKCLLPPVRGAVYPLQLHGHGQVVRVNGHESETDRGFALAGKSFVLRRRKGCRWR